MPVHPHRSLPDAAEYERLSSASRAEIAWEWLRRDPEYRRLSPGTVLHTDRGSLVDHAQSWCEARWGCLNVADADASVRQPVLWSAMVMPSVLSAEARLARDGSEAAFDLRRWALHATLTVDAKGGEHLLLNGDGRTLRVDVEGSLCNGPVNLRYAFDGPEDHDPAIGTLKHLLLLHRTGDFMALPADISAPRRSKDALRVYDALSEGASIRDIGIMLFGSSRVSAEWQAPGEALKSHCRRLIGYARSMSAGGYKSLLR